MGFRWLSYRWAEDRESSSPTMSRLDCLKGGWRLEGEAGVTKNPKAFHVCNCNEKESANCSEDNDCLLLDCEWARLLRLKL